MCLQRRLCGGVGEWVSRCRVPGSVTVERWSGMAVVTLCLLAVLAAASGCDLGTIPRLPRAVTPRQYTLALVTDPLGRHFSGNVSQPPSTTSIILSALTYC